MPPVTQALLFANIGVFALEYLLGLPLGAFALWPLGDPGGRFLPWQMVTYSFLHGGELHLFVNMMALIVFGDPLERTFGSRRYFYFYIACVFTAALTHLIVTPLMGLPALPTVGASGGVFGLLLAFGMLYPRQRVMLLIPPIPMEARWLVLIYGAIELLFGVTGKMAGVAHFAHLGGMLGGFLMIQYYRSQMGPRPRR
ncbi:MAG: rhomboid family intramembrane serine protease [Pseudomonadota bacterium]